MIPVGAMSQKIKINADQEPQAVEQVDVHVFGVRGVCGRAGVRVRTRQFARFCTVPADLEACPRVPPLADK